MKNKFILYVIALLLLFNVIFQFTQLSKIEDVTSTSETASGKISSELSSFRRSQEKVTDSMKATISKLRNDIAAARADNGKLRAQLQQLERRVPPPKK